MGMIKSPVLCVNDLPLITPETREEIHFGFHLDRVDFNWGRMMPGKGLRGAHFLLIPCL